MRTRNLGGCNKPALFAAPLKREDKMERTFVRTCSLIVCLLAIVSHGQRFELPSSSRSHGLQVDGATGKVYTSAGNQLYRLDSNLQQEHAKSLTSDILNISLSSNGRWLVVCLTDLSCEVYNATNLSAQPVFRRENAIRSTENVALFAADDSFYIGNISVDAQGNQEQISLAQYVFDGSQSGTENAGMYNIDRSGFERHFYNGFVRGSNSYYFASDNNPSDVRRLKVMRVCHNSNFGALYELPLLCGGVTPSSDTRVSSLSVIDDFAGMTGPTVLLSSSRPGSSRNFVCLFSLEAIDSMMQSKFDSCSANQNEDIDLSWRSAASIFCLDFQGSSVCSFNSNPAALDDFDDVNYRINGRYLVNLGLNPATVTNFITATTAVIVDSFSFVFVAYVDPSEDSYIIGFNANTSVTLNENDGFDRTLINNGPVSQLQWLSGTEVIYAVTNSSVIQIPVANCSAQSECTSCLGNGNPLCGWCVVENKCSRRNQCQNSQDTLRWIQATEPVNQCPVITAVSPDQYTVDNPQILTLTLSQNLPNLLDNETYLCHFVSNGEPFTVAAQGSGLTYVCNITGSIPAQFQGLTTVFDVSLTSSFQDIPFSTRTGALSVYRCTATQSCSLCLQTNNACGWCVYNKVCSGTADPCINGTDSFLQLNLGASQTYVDVCPLLDRPTSGENYVQPVLVNRNIELVTRNLPAEITNFTYTCRVNGIDLSANYNNMSSLTCIVNNMNQLTLPSGTGQQPVDVTIRWVGPNINHPIDAVTPVSVVLFNCAEIADSCSSCLGSGFDCRWCDRPSAMTDSCTYTGECTATSVSTGASCPRAMVTDFIPTSGPMEGGTTITFTGRELGVTFDDVSITVEGVPCTTTDRDGYESGGRISCITGEASSIGSNSIQITTLSGPVEVGTQFRVAVPQVVRVVPSLGPVAGGTTVTVYGSDLNIGNTENTGVTIVDGTVCEVDRDSIQANIINCTTPQFTGSSDSVGLVFVSIDNANVSNDSVQFTFRADPEFNGVTPSNTILAGGIELIFNGSNFYVEQNPVLIISDPEFMLNMSSCSVINFTAISCITPELTRLSPGDGSGLSYTIRIDNAQGPDPNAESLQIRVSPNPSNFNLVNSEYNTGTNAPIRIMGNNLGSVSNDAYNVTVGGEICNITAVTATEINCIPPKEAPRGNSAATVVVRVGAYLVVPLAEELTYVTGSATTDLLPIIIPVVVGGLAAVVLLSLFIICCVVCYHSKKSKKNEQRWTNLLSQMELMEMEMADECKRAFTELQTDLADLVQISDANLPYRDFRSFAMRFLFPQSGSNHPVLLPLSLPEKTDHDLVVENLKSFQSLIMDKKFLLVFVHTLEGQGARFSLQDKCSVASLLMVAFQNDLDYATEVLQTLLSELMRKSLNSKCHPKLLLRRTESVAEKMLANWLAFLLFPYLLDHVGQPLFTLYRAIKSQLEKGPVDILTGEARHSLSEEKLLRQHIEVKSVEGVVEPESGEDIPIKMLDCDSITQAKEKVLDHLYKNCPASKRPQLTEVDLILQCGTASLVLRDQDHTNKREGDWTKVNTLGSYNVDEMSQKHINNPKLPVPRFKLVKRSERPDSVASFDALGTIIANIGVESRGNLVTSGELAHVYHLVKVEADEGDDGEKRGKIMSEVFLTRLLSTKRILQPYVDAVFESIFKIPQERQLPKAIKSLFDFLDLQASELSIQESEILHTWKTNSVPLRFWVNVIKNPDFVFDIHKSATVDSCLTVIAQAYIDACSTSEMKYTKETPSARLLYVNEVKKYRQNVKSYYNSVQSQPKLSPYEMGEYLRETAQVCATSVEQVYPDLASNDLGPASMTRQLYFVTESALYELFKFAAEYSTEIIDELNEEGLSIMATNFQQLKSSIPV